MNAFATFALFAWVPVSFVVATRYRPSIAAPVLLLGATMFLPQLTWVKVPGILSFDKTTVASFWCAAALVVTRPALLRRLKFRGMLGLLLGLSVVSVVGTALTNTQGFSVGSRPFEGFDLLDLFLMLQEATVALILPFLVGSAVFRSREELRDFFVVLAGAGVVYSVPMLLEKVLSPQFHRWVYGDHQHEFLQTIRAGGYRPMVFMAHGLAVALFTVSAYLAALTLYRAGVRLRRTQPRTVSVYLGALVVACNSAGALVYGLVATPLLLASKRRWAIPVASFLVLFTLSYPLLSVAGLAPRDRLVEIAKQYSGGDRADSLQFRFLNEELCFERGLERPVFGWGGFDRAGVHDPESGRTVSVRDGHWVIVFGERGGTGYLAQIGLLAFPVLLAYRRRRTLVDKADRAMIEGLCVIVGIHVIDLIPNGMFSLLPAFFAGSLHGGLQGVAARRATHAAQRAAAR